MSEVRRPAPWVAPLVTVILGAIPHIAIFAMVMVDAGPVCADPYDSDCKINRELTGLGAFREVFVLPIALLIAGLLIANKQQRRIGMTLLTTTLIGSMVVVCYGCGIASS